MLDTLVVQPLLNLKSGVPGSDGGPTVVFHSYLNI